MSDPTKIPQLHAYRKFGSMREVARYHLGPLYVKYRQRYLLSQWRNSAHSGFFDWDWKKIPYNRIALINFLRAGKPDGKYLEIGCDENAVFHAIPAVYKVGVDPTRGGTHRMTSDAFFARNNEKFDVVFIDGLHTYEQVRQDVINAMKCLEAGGWVALHDLLPRNWIEEHVPIISLGDWNGDVWKVAFELANTEGVEFKLLKIDRGVGVFRLTSPGAQLSDMRRTLQSTRFSYLFDHIGDLPLVEWQEAFAWIQSCSHQNDRC